MTESLSLDWNTHAPNDPTSSLVKASPAYFIPEHCHHGLFTTVSSAVPQTGILKGEKEKKTTHVILSVLTPFCHSSSMLLKYTHGGGRRICKLPTQSDVFYQILDGEIIPQHGLPSRNPLWCLCLFS